MSIFKLPKSRFIFSQEADVIQVEDAPRIMSQDEAMAEFMPQILDSGEDYAKFTEIKARRATPGELVETITSDGKETQNTAKENDYVVTNLGGSGEEYILTEEKLNKRYDNIQGDIWKAKGECRGLLYTGEPTSFMASWGEPMVLKPGDMICSPLPDLNEVYRIARAEFDSTYAPKQDTTKLSHTILHKLASIADGLDAFGFTKEANTMDRILLKLSNDSSLGQDDFLDKYKFEKKRFYELYEEGLIDPDVKDRAEKVFYELENPGSFPEIVPRIGDPKKKMLDRIHFINLVGLSKRQHIKD